MIKREIIENIKINEVKEYENNPRKNDKSVDFVINSIKEFGYGNPIIVDENMEIIAGHTRLKALKKLKWEVLPEIIKISGLTESQKKAYRIADNSTSSGSEWDLDKLHFELVDIDLNMDLFGLELPEQEDLTDYVGDKKRLADKFIIPPFDIFDAKQKDWLNRKRLWNTLIKDKGDARADIIVYNNKDTNNKSKYKDNGVMENEMSLLDPVLSEVITLWFTPHKECNVFDCFAGDTIFGFVSGYLGHKFTGIELRQEQVDFNNNRVSKFNLNANYICDDGCNVAKHIKEKSQDLLFSCPPYYDLEVYSDLENDASNQESYEDFFKIIDKAFSDAIDCLKDDRFAVIVCGDVRNKKTGAYYGFPTDIIRLFEKKGLILYNNIKMLTPFGTAQIRATKYMENRKTVHIYQDVLVFYKGNTKNIKNQFGFVEVKELQMGEE